MKGKSMEKNPKVSVIMPIYNSSEFLKGWFGQYLETDIGGYRDYMCG